MVFKKMLAALGVGGPSVDTVLTNPSTRPGLTLEGHIELTGGDVPAKIEYIALGLVTRAEVEHGDGEAAAGVEFHRVEVSGAFELPAKENRSIPFSVAVPWETPVTELYGQRLPGMTMGLRTELAIARAVDKGDLDAVYVHPLPTHEAILDAFRSLGFQLKNADLEVGHIPGTSQQLPFYQEIEYYAAPQYAGEIREVEVTFITTPRGVEVVLEFDKRGGMFSSGHDSFGRYTVGHDTAGDLTGTVDGWIRQAITGYQSYAAEHGHHKHSGHGHHGGGMGGVVAGVAAGAVGGYVVGEMVEDFFEGEEEEDE